MKAILLIDDDLLLDGIDGVEKINVEVINKSGLNVAYQLNEIEKVLKPLPDEKPLTNKRGDTQSLNHAIQNIFNSGFNSCLREIRGE